MIMSGMYPNNQDIEIFGEQVSWPGVDANGKFTNGSFSDPMVKPSFIPAETINLVLDNLESVIRKCGETPNATGLAQIADLITPLASPKGIIMRDEHGRAKVSAPEAADDIARLAEITAAIKEATLDLTSHADQIDGKGRNLLEVLGVSTIPEAMAEIRRRCNNNGEIDNTGVPDFGVIRIGDYIDGLDFSGIAPPSAAAAPNGGPQAWNDTYKNNRIVVSGFNTYKNSGDTENTKNHVLFTFRNVLWQMRQRAANDNTGGYAYNNTANEIRAYLEGLAGDGTGVFALGLESALDGGVTPTGGKYLYTIRKAHSIKGNYAWNSYTVWLPTEIEVFGYQTYGDEANQYNLNVQLPIYQNSAVYRIKRRNGSRAWHWESTPTAAGTTSFAQVNSFGGAASTAVGFSDGGVSPAFCVA
jgi:hypothetical protein